MKFKISDRGDHLEVTLTFADLRVVDLEPALESAARRNKWQLSLASQRYDKTVYRIDDSHGIFQATVRFTHGMEPPTLAYIGNRPPDDEHDWRVSRPSTRAVAVEFLKECADRGLISDARRDLILIKLSDIRDLAEV